jgi:hypothetical protein
VSGARRTARNTTGDGWHSSYFLVLLIASSPVVRQQPARLFDGLRQSNRAKEILRIEVILAGFIDDPDETVLLGIGGGGLRRSSASRAKPDSHRYRRIRLAVFLVSLPWLQISQQVLDLEFLAPDSGGFIPMYFSNARRAIGYGRDNIQTEALPS